MKILLLTAYFPPDTGSAAHLFFELGSELASRGHQVTVITNKPGYHAQGSLEKYKTRLIVEEIVNNMNVIRVPSLRLPPKIMVGRALWQFSMAFIFFVVGMFISRPQVTIVYSPPLTLGLSAWTLRIFRRIPFILNVQDLFPQSIIDLGLLKNPKVINWFEKMETFLYSQANMVTVHSSGNRRHVIDSGGADDRVTIMPNWVDTSFIRPGNRKNKFSSEYHLDDSFVVSFAGVMGFSQDLDVMIGAAKMLVENNDIRWIIVGDGVEKDRLVAQVKELNLEQNIIFVPMVPREEYPSVLHASDVSLATLHSDVNTPVVPSKILSIMAAGKPVIVAMNLDGDAPRLVEEAECGICVPPGDSKALAEAVVKLYQDPALVITMGKNGRDYSTNFLSLKTCVSRYEESIRELSGNKE